jgi:hypothetical protein
MLASKKVLNSKFVIKDRDQPKIQPTDNFQPVYLFFYVDFGLVLCGLKNLGSHILACSRIRRTRVHGTQLKSDKQDNPISLRNQT